MGEMTLPLMGCYTQESGPCTSPGQHSRADLIDRDTGDHVPNSSRAMWRCRSGRGRDDRPLPQSLAACGRWQSWLVLRSLEGENCPPLEEALGRAGSIPHPGSRIEPIDGHSRELAWVGHEKSRTSRVLCPVPSHHVVAWMRKKIPSLPLSTCGT